jgi:[ribosomal protein S5]-alanine N-acetyltransferase
MLRGKRVVLRPLTAVDFAQWSEVRARNADWLTKWEPSRPPGSADIFTDRHAFASRCSARERERHLGSGYGFGVFVDGALGGEMNLSSVQRGPFQNCYVGYWIDEKLAGHSYTPEALVVVLRFGFEELGLHRMQISIIPRNAASRRVVEKLEIRSEGIAARYLEINGAWEDHMRFAMTAEDWLERSDELIASWIG